MVMGNDALLVRSARTASGLVLMFAFSMPGRVRAGEPGTDPHPAFSVGTAACSGEREAETSAFSNELPGTNAARETAFSLDLGPTFVPETFARLGRLPLGAAEDEAQASSWRMVGLGASLGIAPGNGWYQSAAMGELGFSLGRSRGHPRFWASTIGWEITTVGDFGFFGSFRTFNSFFPVYLHFTPRMELKTKMVHPYVEGRKWEVKDSGGSTWATIEEEGYVDTSRLEARVFAKSMIDIYVGGSTWANFGETSFLKAGVRFTGDWVGGGLGFTMGGDLGVIVTPSGTGMETIPYLGFTVCITAVSGR